MPKKTLKIVRPQDCIGCDLCCFACSQKKTGNISFSGSIIKVWPKKNKGFTIQVDCGACDNCGECVKACPKKCLELS